MPDGPNLHSPVLPPMPVDEQVERIVLACAIQQPTTLDMIPPGLGPDAFAIGAHARVWQTMMRLREIGDPIDALTVGAAIQGDPDLLDVGGGRAFAVDLAAQLVSTVDVAAYARRLLDVAAKRRVYALAQEVIARACDMSDPADTADRIADFAWDGLHAATEIGTERRPIVTLGEALNERVAAKQDTTTPRRTYRTGLSALDDALGPLEPQEMILTAARPAMGKTSFATRIAINIASDMADAGTGAVLFISREMSKEAIAAARFREDAGVTPIAWGRLDDHSPEWHGITRVQADMARLPIYIDDQAEDLAAIERIASRLKRQHGDVVVVIDYLGLLKGPPQARGRYEEMSAISRGCKQMAKRLDALVMPLAQLNREVERRPDKRPVLSDLRDSGDLEQDADRVLMLYREAYYLAQEHDQSDPDVQQKMAACRDRADVLIRKNRHGATATVELGFRPVAGGFCDWTVPRADDDQDIMNFGGPE